MYGLRIRDRSFKEMRLKQICYAEAPPSMNISYQESTPLHETSVYVYMSAHAHIQMAKMSNINIPPHKALTPQYYLSSV